MQSEDELSDSLAQLQDLDVSYTLGRHTAEDIRWADLIIKNPGVPDDLPILQGVSTITNDIAYFLSHTSLPTIAVTGTKGKSTTTALVSYMLRKHGFTTYTGGNIGTSPLEFIDDVLSNQTSRDSCPQRQMGILELSSWQIHDLARSPFRPFELVVLTPFYPDHQNRYDSLDSYIEDKLKIFSSTSPPPCTVIPANDPYLAPHMNSITTSQRWYYSTDGELPKNVSGIWYHEKCILIYRNGECIDAVEASLDDSAVPALCAAYALSLPIHDSIEAIKQFPGIAHRREHLGVKYGIEFINDSAATIPEAVLFSVRQTQHPIHLIFGGADKDLDPFSVLDILPRIESLHLLGGSYTDKVIPLLRQNGIPYSGPFTSLESAVKSALLGAMPGSTILLSPGCASFGMFRHEFDRGDTFKTIFNSL